MQRIGVTIISSHLAMTQAGGTSHAAELNLLSHAHVMAEL